MLALLIAASAAAACPTTEVAGAPGENHVMFHGLSPDWRTLAVGWDKGSGADTRRGAYLLDLRTAKRSDLPLLNNAPTFSRDGRYLVAANYAGQPLRTEVFELDRKTGAARTYASAESAEWLASYSPDGHSILFNSTRTGGSDLYRAWRDNGAVEQVTSDPRYEAHASFIDGGKRIIFHRQTGGDDYDVVIRDLASSAEQVVGATPLEEAYPAMSPDGRWILFSAVPEAGRQPNLYVMRRDGSGRTRLTDGTAKDAYATWSPDGRAVYFVRFGEGGSTILRMKMRRGACAR